MAMVAAELRAQPGQSRADRFRRCVDADLPENRRQLVQLTERAGSDPHLHTAVRSPMLGRPMFLGAGQRDALQTDLTGLQELLLSLPQRLFDSDVGAMCERLSMPGSHQMAIEETWHDQRVLLNRTDLIRADHGFRALEVNLHSSLGGVDSGPWHRAQLEVPFIGRFVEQEQLHYVDPIDGVAGHLRSAAKAIGFGAFPSMAIVDWPTSYPALAPRLQRLAGLFRSRGFDAFSCHAGELSFENSRLKARGRRVDVVYRAFVIEDVAGDPKLLAPLLAAHRAGRVLLAMGFIAELVGNKGALAFLSDPEFAADFTADERRLVDRILPATRFVTDHETTWGDERINVLELAERDRENLVLKPSGGYSARGVVPGWRTDPDHWRAVVQRAAGGAWVLQERLRPVPELVPEVDGDGIIQRAMDVNWGVFVVDGAYNGTMIRARPAVDADVISTATGASIGGCFVAP